MAAHHDPAIMTVSCQPVRKTLGIEKREARPIRLGEEPMDPGDRGTDARKINKSFILLQSN
jgi:hypothetical protein